MARRADGVRMTRPTSNRRIFSDATAVERAAQIERRNHRRRMTMSRLEMVCRLIDRCRGREFHLLLPALLLSGCGRADSADGGLVLLAIFLLVALVGWLIGRTYE